MTTSSPEWQARQYSLFEEERTRPVRDLPVARPPGGVVQHPRGRLQNVPRLVEVQTVPFGGDGGDRQAVVRHSSPR